MKIEEYLALYERYRDNVKRTAKALEMMKAGMSENEEATLFLQGDPCEILEKQYKRKCKILRKAQERMIRAIYRINDPEVVRLLTLKYFCDLSNDKAAENMNYSQRQFYRIAKKARADLYEKLVLEMPKPKRSPKSCVYKRVFKGRKSKYRKYAYRDKKGDVKKVQTVKNEKTKNFNVL